MNPDGSVTTFHEALLRAHVVKQLLDLRELLVRHDENLKAWRLLECAPYFVWNHPALEAARADQYEMTKHVLPREELRAVDRETDPYEAYYRTNAHEKRFEEMYGLAVEDAHRIPRVEFLLKGLRIQQRGAADAAHVPSVLDLSANDGWMAARLSLAGYPCDCLDLHPGNCETARERMKAYPFIGRVAQGPLEDAPMIFMDSVDQLDRVDGEWRYSGGTDEQWDAVVCFETVEHVRDPHALLDTMRACCNARPGARLYVSTPHGTDHEGNLPTWDQVEPKGHVRVYREQDFRALLEEVGEVEELVEGPDRVLVARVKPHG